MRMITETENQIRPLSMALSNAALKSVNFTLSMLDAFRERQRKLEAAEIARQLKSEFPYESEEFLTNLVLTGKFEVTQ